MSITIRAVIRQDRAKPDGKCPLAICVTINRQRTYKNIGVSVPPQYWNETDKQVKKGYPNYDHINAKINKQITELEKELLNREINNEHITLNVIKSLLTKKGDVSKDFIAYTTDMLDEIGKTRSMATKRVYSSRLDSITKYCNGRLSFGDITPGWLSQYYKWMIAGGTHHNTTLNSFKLIRMVFNNAKEQGIVSYYPFDEWKYPAYKESNKQYLTLLECEALEKQLYDNKLDALHKTVLAFFMVECYVGIRHSDWHKFTTEKLLEGENFVLYTTKTKQRITVPLGSYPRLQKIVHYIRDNNLTYNQTLEHTNRMLKTIAGVSGVQKNLTTHVGRHTAATLLLEAGMSEESVCAVLGVGIKIVKTYAKLTGRKLKREFEGLQGL